MFHVEQFITIPPWFDINPWKNAFSWSGIRNVPRGTFLKNISEYSIVPRGTIG